MCIMVMYMIPLPLQGVHGEVPGLGPGYRGAWQGPTASPVTCQAWLLGMLNDYVSHSCYVRGGCYVSVLGVMGSAAFAMSR